MGERVKKRKEVILYVIAETAFLEKRVNKVNLLSYLLQDFAAT